MQVIKNELRTFITDSIMYGHSTDFLTDDGSFLENGVIDSTGVLELINYIEGRFGIKVDDDELVPENLDSINGLIRFIERKGGGARLQLASQAAMAR
jgi:acyl carrier protein